jgi:MOSC domain-containing protein YiiM
MTTRPQPGGLERELDVLRHVTRAHDGSVGTRARVLRPGVVRDGDEVRLVG